MPLKLPFSNKNNSAQAKHEASLDDILPTTASRVDLILLVALCTDSMRDVLAAAFVKSSVRDQKSEKDIEDVDEQGDEDGESPAFADVQAFLGLDLNSTRMQTLKVTSLDHFNEWRTSVLKRLGESLSVQSDAVRQTKARYPVQRSTVNIDSLPFRKVDVPPSLTAFDDKQRALVLGAVLFILLSLGKYSAHSRVLMEYLCTVLKLPQDVLSSEEATTAVTLLQTAASKGMDGEEAKQKKANDNAFGRKWKVGLAAVAGAVVIGITGGLAAPLMIGAAGAIMGGVGLGGLATLLGATIINPVTIAALFGALGGRMTGRAMEKYARDVEDFKFMPVHDPEFAPMTESADEAAAVAPEHKLRVAIGISGWVTKESDIVRPWRVFSEQTLEAFALRYEQAALISLGNTLDKAIRDSAFGLVRGRAITFLLPILSSFMAPIGMLKAGKFLDNPFTIALQRSDKAGKVLAHAIMEKAQGERPVTLIGFSMGARVVFACLEELAANNAFGLVEHAVLIGSPVPSAEMAWRRMRAVVAGRLMNVYATKDYILSYLYRARNAQFGIAGIQAITAVQNVENVDVSRFVDGHNQYRLAIGRILQEINFADLDLEQVQQENMELEAEKIYEQEICEKAEKEGKFEALEQGHDVEENKPALPARSTQESGIAKRFDHRPPEYEEEDRPILPPRRTESSGITKQLDQVHLKDEKAEHDYDEHEQDDDNDSHYDDDDDEEDEQHRSRIQMTDLEPEAMQDTKG